MHAATETTSFKSYSSRSKAKRALRDTYGVETEHTLELFLTVQDDKHGFFLKDGTPFVQYAQQDAAETELRDYTDPAVQAAVIAEVEASDPLVEPVAGAALSAEEQDTADDEAPAPSAAAFGAFALGQLTAPSNSQPAAPSTGTSPRTEGLKIEKDREAQNGVKARSKGGLCRAVWDQLNSMMLHDEATGLTSIPTAAEIKKVAEEKGWNVNNASIEYYQWRKFHGISGRGKKTI